MTLDTGSSTTPSWITIGSVSSLLASHRHHVTLRTATTQPTLYHSILLFSFTNPLSAGKDGKSPSASQTRTWYAMVSQCPHLGAPLESAPVRRVETSSDRQAAVQEDPDGEEIDFCEDDGDDIEDAVIICPWHEYDFDLRSGESSTGLQACTYRVRVVGEGDEAMVEVESMAREDDARPTQWEVTEIRAVSEGELAIGGQGGQPWGKQSLTLTSPSLDSLPGSGSSLASGSSQVSTYACQCPHDRSGATHGSCCRRLLVCPSSGT
jgi:hypothetical protein